MSQVSSALQVVQEIQGKFHTAVRPAGFMGEFGNGLWRIFTISGTFVAPAAKIRVRVLGAGGGGDSGKGGNGGLGGGGGGCTSGSGGGAGGAGLCIVEW